MADRSSLNNQSDKELLFLTAALFVIKLKWRENMARMSNPPYPTADKALKRTEEQKTVYDVNFTKMLKKIRVFMILMRLTCDF